MKADQAIGRLRETLGLPVAAVARVDQGPGKPHLWTLRLRDGRQLVLGDGRHVRDRWRLSAVLEAVGAPPVTAGAARRTEHYLKAAVREPKQ